tara:strand:- start:878 stop:2014 length:1137 start_codon:yes stop_codon:yes gene_type:complete
LRAGKINQNFEDDLFENIQGYLISLANPNNKFQFYPANNGLLKNGEKLSLGFSCLALKSYYMTGLWERQDISFQNQWIDFINSFQKKNNNFPLNSYIDDEYLNGFSEIDIKRQFKNITKNIVNLIMTNKFDTDKKKIQDGVRAETKQAISTLYQVKSKNKLRYIDFPYKDHQIKDFLTSLNWQKPWSAGAQFSALCVFVSTQLDKSDQEESIRYLKNFIGSLANTETGGYFLGSTPSSKEYINGAMKVLTGLDWIEQKIHYPEKLIDYCLDNTPSQEGCDIVDIIYVLYRCAKETSYKRLEIEKYLIKQLEIIEKHYFYGKGGFSYFINKSQITYYGLQITSGLKTPDLHGTTLLLWALSMIYEINFPDKKYLKVIKP